MACMEVKTRDCCKHFRTGENSSVSFYADRSAHLDYLEFLFNKGKTE